MKGSKQKRSKMSSKAENDRMEFATGKKEKTNSILTADVSIQ